MTESRPRSIDFPPASIDFCALNPGRKVASFLFYNLASCTGLGGPCGRPGDLANAPIGALWPFLRIRRIACAAVLAWPAGAVEAASIGHQLAHELDLLQLQKTGEASPQNSGRGPAPSVPQPAGQVRFREHPGQSTFKTGEAMAVA
jgi:hypothetical protein